MKIYVALGSWDYEGYDIPLGVYSSAALAREALAKGYRRYDDRDILEYELDELAEWPKKVKPNNIPLSTEGVIP